MSIIGPCSQAGRLRAGALKHSLTSRQNQNCQTQTLFYTTKTLRVIRIMAQLEWLKRSSPTWEFWAALCPSILPCPHLRMCLGMQVVCFTRFALGSTQGWFASSAATLHFSSLPQRSMPADPINFKMSRSLSAFLACAVEAHDSTNGERRKASDDAIAPIVS